MGQVRTHILPLLVVFGARTLLVALGVALIFGRAGDIPFYYGLAAESAKGRLPYVQFWVEYPPLFPWLAVAAFRLAQAVGGGQARQAFTLILTVFNLAVEYVNLGLMYALATRLYGRRQAFKSTLLYALLLPPVVFALLGMIEPLAELFLLLGLLLGLQRHAVGSGVALGLGVLTKLYPALALPGLLALFSHRERGALISSCAALVGGTLLLLGLVSPRALAGSISVSAGRPPWETPWAVLEGCCPVGSLTPPAERGVTPDSGSEFRGRIPWPLVSLGFAAAYVILLVRRRAPIAERDVIVATLFGGTVLLLWSRGFSPQFVEWLLPLLLLAFPFAAGPRLALGYTVLTFLEYASVAPGSPLLGPVFLVLVLGRTLLTLVAAIVAARAWLKPPPLADPAPAQA